MANNSLPEVWLRGPLTDITPLLQPVAHALMQAREELNLLMEDFPDNLLWHKVAGMASPGFHLQHLTGVIDRLFTYANGESLTDDQLNYLATEGKPTTITYTVKQLVTAFNNRVNQALVQLSQADVAMLINHRNVGRGKLPSTVIGLYVHSTEHTMRHLGQLIVTVNVLTNSDRL